MYIIRVIMYSARFCSLCNTLIVPVLFDRLLLELATLGRLVCIKQNQCISVYRLKVRSIRHILGAHNLDTDTVVNIHTDYTGREFLLMKFAAVVRLFLDSQ